MPVWMEVGRGKTEGEWEGTVVGRRWVGGWTRDAPGPSTSEA